ncbi:MAG TPA: YCF48-related protein, partial [Ignavibacteria bacterium]|nr:YCF48-related protein [Ignavibacteria bacterium]
MVQWIIRAGEYNQPGPATPGNITKFYFFVAPTYPLNATYTGFYIKMGRTSLTNLPTGSFYSGPMDTVFYRPGSYNINAPASAWFEFILDRQIAYYPDSSLVIEIGQCSSTQGTGFSVQQQSTVPQQRLYSVGGCPFVYSGTQASRTLNSGITVIPFAVNCSYSWAAQTSGTTSLLYSVKAVNDMVCWAVGAAATVRKTTDGGTTWTNGNPNPGVITGDIYNVEAIDANNAWVTTSGASTFIYKTTNGGTNWVQVYSLAGGFINAIKMQSATNGIATGDVIAGTWLMVVTTNGGTNWTTLPTAPAGTGDGRNNCLQVTLPNIWFGTGQGTIWRSTNSGINWSSSPTTGLAGQVLAVHFNSTTHGLGGGATMVRSTNGGGTYALLTALGTGNITGIQGLGSDYWYCRGTGIFRSTNSGDNWTQVHTAVTAQNDLSFATGSNG